MPKRTKQGVRDLNDIGPKPKPRPKRDYCPPHAWTPWSDPSMFSWTSHRRCQICGKSETKEMPYG